MVRVGLLILGLITASVSPAKTAAARSGVTCKITVKTHYRDGRFERAYKDYRFKSKSQCQAQRRRLEVNFRPQVLMIETFMLWRG